MRALIYLWNPKEVAFSLGPHVLSPTIEEYFRLLLAPPTSEVIYIPNFSKGAVNIIAKFFNIKHREVSLALEDCNEHYIKLSTLMYWFSTLGSFKEN